MSTDSSPAIERVLVIGAGTMGHGIAHVAAQAGCKAFLYDVDPAVVESGLGKVKANLQKGVDRGKVTEEARWTQRSRISPPHPFDLAEARGQRSGHHRRSRSGERIELKQSIFQTI